MPIIIERQDVDGALSLREFISFLETTVDVSDAESLAEAAPQFQALANDEDLVASHLDAQIKKYFSAGSLDTNGPQSLILGAGRDFFLRANIWLPPQISGAFRAQEAQLYSYGNMHDHNFGFMTVGYFGPGYTTDLYIYDPTKVVGHVGEAVDLEFVETTTLPKGRVMVYREKVDVHTQFPPEALTISLNVMVPNKGDSEKDQYFFDAGTRTITGMPEFAIVHKRASIVALAGAIANENTTAVLIDLMTSAPCRRVREAAVSALAGSPLLDRSLKCSLIETAVDDRDTLVSGRARAALSELAIE